MRNSYESQFGFTFLLFYSILFPRIYVNILRIFRISFYVSRATQLLEKGKIFTHGNSFSRDFSLDIIPYMRVVHI